MRAEGPNCTTQHHPLTSEAAAVVKQAVTLAKNRGHSQVTPLHVASTMLSSNPINNGNNGNVTGILRTACLSSLSHPLHCRALELCLNVALNRLPATSTVQFGDDYYGSTVGGVYPSVSNALVAAFKRAHAHQRRGLVENQANAIVTKIELDQLVVSILDDPSVSRVMKEAGFSSSQVKNNVERRVYPEKEDSETNCPSIRSEDIEYVFGNLAGARKKSFVIIGESLGTAEGIVRKVMERIESGEVPQSLRGLRTLDVSLASFEHLTKDETVRKFNEFKNHTKGRLILQVGSLQKWISHLEDVTIEDTSTPSRLKPPKEQSPILHLVLEIGRLLKREGEDEYGTNIQLIGFATIRSYYESRNSSNPSLETLWRLHPLNIDRKELEVEKDRNSKLKDRGNESCWLHLLPKDKEVKKGKRKSFVNELPPWLQQYKDEINVNKAYQGYDGVMEEYNNTSPISFRHPKFMSLPPSPSPSTNSDFSFDHQRHNHDWPLTNQSRRSFDFHLSNSNPNSTSSSDGVEFVAENAPKFMELNAENMKTLCCHLENKIPSHKYVVIPKIASTVLRCRSGMLKRKGLSTILGGGTKSDTWMVFSGVDTENMQKMARELARIVFGSYSNFISLSVIEDGGTTTTTISKKRPRDGNTRGHFERFWESIRGDPHRVFVIEDVEKAESCSLTALRKYIETGKVESLFGGEVGIRDAIVILIYQCHSRSRWSRNDGNCNLLDLNRVVEDEEEKEGERINDKSVVIDDVGILDYVDEVIMFD